MYFPVSELPPQFIVSNTHAISLNATLPISFFVLLLNIQSLRICRFQIFSISEQKLYFGTLEVLINRKIRKIVWNQPEISVSILDFNI